MSKELDDLWNEMQKSRNSAPDKTTEEILAEVDSRYGNGTAKANDNSNAGVTKQYTRPPAKKAAPPATTTTTPPANSGEAQPPSAIARFNMANDRLNREAVGYERPRGLGVLSTTQWVGSIVGYLGKTAIRGAQDFMDEGKLKAASEELLASGVSDPDSIKAVLTKHGVTVDDATAKGISAVSAGYQETQAPDFTSHKEVLDAVQKEQTAVVQAQAGEELKKAVEAADKERNAEAMQAQKNVSDTHELLNQAQYEAQNNTMGVARANTLNQGAQNARDNLQNAMTSIGALLGGGEGGNNTNNNNIPTLAQPATIQPYKPAPNGAITAPTQQQPVGNNTNNSSNSMGMMMTPEEKALQDAAEASTATNNQLPIVETPEERRRRLQQPQGGNAGSFFA
jgi:hypothetical protein